MKRILFILATFIFEVKAYSQEVKLGVITDFDKSMEIDSILRFVEAEINRTAGPAKQFDLDDDGVSYGIKGLQEAQSEYQTLSNSKQLTVNAADDYMDVGVGRLRRQSRGRNLHRMIVEFAIPNNLFF